MVYRLLQSLIGMVARKTYILKSLPVLRHDLMRHFLRGYFDGDGYILQSRKTIGVSTYNREMAASIQTWLIQELDGRPVQLIHSTIWHYRKSGNEAITIMSYLHNNSIIYLGRKYHQAQTFINQAPTRGSIAATKAAEARRETKKRENTNTLFQELDTIHQRYKPPRLCWTRSA